MIDLSLFDVEAYLNHKNIPYDLEGKNISEDWIGVQCPFPHCSDESNHLGIHADSKNISCWICGTSGSIIKYLRQIEEKHNVYDVLKRFSSRVCSATKKSNSTRTAHSRKDFSVGSVVSNIEKELPQAHREYLRQRRFNPNTISNKYLVSGTGPMGAWKLRLIIPIIANRRIYSFVGRDITGKADKQYKNCPNELSVLPVKSMIYNIDNVGDTGIVVEGILDVWRIGEGSCATFGIKTTTIQQQKLMQMERVFILFDPDAQREADILAHNLATLVPHVETIFLDEGDPADMLDNDIKVLRKQIFGKIY